MSSEKMKLPSGEQSWSETETTIAQAAIEEPADDTLLRPARRGVGRVVRAETVHHYRRALVVHIRPSQRDVALTQSFHRFDRRAPFQEATTIGMSPGEARRIGELLIAAADEAEAVYAPGEDQGSGVQPNTASSTSLPPGVASSNVSDAGSRFSVSPSANAFSEMRRSSSLRACFSASVDSLLSSMSISVRRIASTAICWPKAKLSLSIFRILSSMVTRHLHGSRPGEAVELHAPGLAGAWPVAPTEGAAA